MNSRRTIAWPWPIAVSGSVEATRPDQEQEVGTTNAVRGAEVSVVGELREDSCD